jgi:hypothetical protein
MFGIEKDIQDIMKVVYGPLNKDKQPPDTIEIGGVKYKRIEEPQSFYDKLWGLLSTKISDNVYACDDMADKVRDLIRENIPTPYKGVGLHEWYLGYNECIERIKNNLK